MAARTIFLDDGAYEVADTESGRTVWLDDGALMESDVAGGGGGGGVGTDLPQYHFSAEPQVEDPSALIAAQEAGIFFIDAPQEPILLQYHFGEAPILLPQPPTLHGGIWLPERLPDANPDPLSDLSVYWYGETPILPVAPETAALATVAIVQTAIEPVIPIIGDYFYGEVPPPPADPAVLIAAMADSYLMIPLAPPVAGESAGNRNARLSLSIGLRIS